MLAFFITGRMISIRLNNTDEVVKGRIYLYDDTTKVLILKLWKDAEHEGERGRQVGMGVYNALNVTLEKIHAFEDLYAHEHDSSDLDPVLNDGNESYYTNEFTCSDDSLNKRVMDRHDKFCEEQAEKRRKMLDEKYGQKKALSTFQSIRSSSKETSPT